MKELKEYICKHKVKIALATFALIFLIPAIINILFKYSPICELLGAEWEAGDALGFYGTLLGSAATIVGVYLSIDAAQKSYHEDEINKVRPYLALTHLISKSRMTLDSLIGSLENNQIREKTQNFYEEYRFDKVYIIIKSDKIEFQNGLTKVQENILASSGFRWNKDGATYSLKAGNLISMPFEIENVGNGSALNFQICFYREGEEKRGVNIFTLKVGQSAYCHIFSDEQDNAIICGKYILEFIYNDIRGSTYSQKYDLELKSDGETKTIKKYINLQGQQKRVF